MSEPIHIRPARPDDREFLVGVAPRFVEFGPPPWRDGEQMTGILVRNLERVLAARPPGTEMLIAEDAAGTRLGFIFLEPQTDYFTELRHGHISDIAVSKEGEGRGVGRALMEAAEAWALAQGFGHLTLNVFSRNGNARGFYERMGYGEDTVRLYKPLGESSRNRTAPARE
ncbi:GNAT family N-acetyltransferase [Vitiosangium sp. GDMCC 1.1324]|uniref:GNAT family N-acetyltransferase n=1 Tax=Vitiosangium sp. (strain GDMCC 1.1324) TaxID=2138576 RepID=UPI00130E733D|nr:GNAT family N-acetyltransferase [Vitiosangium sp. GDMCC 1.1324]